MSKVYTVESGEYSDYSVHGIFSSRENATEFIKFYGKSSYNEMEICEKTLNPTMEEIKQGLELYYVSITYDGKVGIEISRHDWVKHGSYRFVGSYNSPLTRKTLIVYLFTDSVERATKIISDKRRELIALNKWGVE